LRLLQLFSIGIRTWVRYGLTWKICWVTLPHSSSLLWCHAFSFLFHFHDFVWNRSC